MRRLGYIVIPDWIYGLDLNLVESVVLSVIFGFSQDGEGCFTGSRAYLAERIRVKDRKTVDRALQGLLDRGYIEKVEAIIKGVKYNAYKVAKSLLEEVIRKGSEGSEGVENLDGGCGKNGQGGVAKTDTIKDNIKENTPISPKRVRPSGFNFRQSLIDLGVTEETADAWIEVRRLRRALNTERAFTIVKNQIAKAGATAEECIALAARKQWQGFEAIWFFNEQKKRGQIDPFRSAPVQNPSKVREL